MEEQRWLYMIPESQLGVRYYNLVRMANSFPSWKGKKRKPQSAEHVQKRAQAMIGKNVGKNRAPKEIVTCPVCGKSGGKAAMIQWHFDLCGQGLSSRLRDLRSRNAKRQSEEKMICQCGKPGTQFSLARWHLGRCRLEPNSYRCN